MFKQIVDEIKQSGGIGVDRYIELCNTHYYSTRDPLGVKGDFTTAPEISQIFGEMIGIWAITQWEKIGSPEKFALLELGPGRGTLMADLLRATKVVPGFKPEIHLVELSPTLIAIQKAKLSATWHREVPTLDIPTIIIANEFFDALPVKQFIGKLERKVVYENGQLAFNIATEDGITNEICESGLQIMRRLTAQAAAGIIIDYGYTTNSRKNTLQAVKNHKYHNVLENPGEADLTTLVNFPALVEQAAKPCKITTQREFLLAHGADVRAKVLNKEQDLERLISPEQMGELFKVLCF